MGTAHYAIYRYENGQCCHGNTIGRTLLSLGLSYGSSDSRLAMMMRPLNFSFLSVSAHSTEAGPEVRK